MASGPATLLASASRAPARESRGRRAYPSVAVHHLMPLQAPFARERGADHVGLVVPLAVRLHAGPSPPGGSVRSTGRCRAGPCCGGAEYGSGSLAYGLRAVAPRRAAPSIAYNRSQAAVAARASRTHVRNTVVMIVLAILAAATWVATWQRQAAEPPAAASADAQPLGYYLRGDTAARHGRRKAASSIASTPSASMSCQAKRGCGSRASASITSPRPKPPWAHLGSERERAEGWVAARARRQRRGSQLASRRFEACNDHRPKAAVLARHLERRVGRRSSTFGSAIGNSTASVSART